MHSSKTTPLTSGSKQIWKLKEWNQQLFLQTELLQGYWDLKKFSVFFYSPFYNKMKLLQKTWLYSYKSKPTQNILSSE